MRILLVLLFSLSAWANESPAPLDPQKAAESAVVPKGFHVDLIAAEPDIRQPVALAIDDRGRLWVAEAYSYPKHTSENQRDRIVIFEDTNADGTFDKRTVFYDKLNYVSGLEIGFGGAWVMSPPYFYFIPDANNDDVPDSKPKLLLDGFGTHANSHNIANGFAWGPDGWLYSTHGRTNWSMIGKPGAKKEERTRFDGGVWRYHPRRHEWEPFADGCTNPWGIDWDDYGQAFIPNTVNPHLFHAIQGAHYEPWRNRESSRYAYKRIETIADHLHFLGGKSFRDGLGSKKVDDLGGGHSHCGILVYLGDNFPDRYRNTVFLHNTHGKRMNNDILVRKGSGYTASHGKDFYFSKDPWFMGVNFRTGPSGAVYFTDWSDTGECHSTRNTRKETGRLFRVRYGEIKYNTIDLEKKSDSELVEFQLHKNDWFVRHARRILHERYASGADLKKARSQLTDVLENNPDITRKLRAFWALHVTGRVPKLTNYLDHPDENLRSWSVRLLTQDGAKPPIDKFVSMAKSDASLLVRLHLASALQRIESKYRWEMAKDLMGHEESANDQNLPFMIWYGTEPLVHDDIERFAGLVLFSKIPFVQESIARRIASHSEPELGLDRICKIIPDLDTESQKMVIKGLLMGLKGRKGISPPQGWLIASESLKKGGLSKGASELGLLFGDTSAIDQLKRIAEDKSKSAKARKEAVEQLLNAKPKKLAEWLLQYTKDPVIGEAAVAGLARFPHKETKNVLIKEFNSLGAAQNAAIQTLATRKDWAKSLLDEIEKGSIAKSNLNAYYARQIASLDSKLEARITELWGTIRSSPKDKRKQIEKYMKKYSRGELGDKERGQGIYQQLCAACHKMNGEGGEVGPELTGSQRSLEYLFENIFDPSATVAKEYQLQIFVLNNGTVISGFVKAETDTTLTIGTIDESLTVAKSDIEEQKLSPVSTMPEGLIDSLNEEQIRDLLAYLKK